MSKYCAFQLENLELEILLEGLGVGWASSNEEDSMSKQYTSIMVIYLPKSKNGVWSNFIFT